MQELYRPDKQAYSSLLLETWLNEVLHTVTPASCSTSVKVCTRLPPVAFVTNNDDAQGKVTWPLAQDCSW